MREQGMSLTQFISKPQDGDALCDPQFGLIMSHIALAGKAIGREIRRAALANNLGPDGTVNIQGESVKKLDRVANETLIRFFHDSGLISYLVSEEMDEPLQIKGRDRSGKFVLLFDPLDGSSNTEVNGSLGSIFSIHRAKDPARPDPRADILKKGSEQVAACYVLYGPSTVLIYSSGRTVQGFALDPEEGEFILTHPSIRIPARGKTYSVNQGNYMDWPSETQYFIDFLQSKNTRDGKPYSLRYAGTLVADFHRTLLEGGIFLYPAGAKNPDGKLRLLYEAAPMSFIVEAAGGKAITGTNRAPDRILDVAPSSLHQRIPLIIGSAEEVELAVEFFRGTRHK